LKHCFTSSNLIPDFARFHCYPLLLIRVAVGDGVGVVAAGVVAVDDESGDEEVEGVEVVENSQAENAEIFTLL
jgi:hypothetical protein